MINVYIISGFLGAGKTTFIQKLLSEKKFGKVMLLENEFGEVGVDGAFFDSALNVKEINNFGGAGEKLYLCYSKESQRNNSYEKNKDNRCRADYKDNDPRV